MPPLLALVPKWLVRLLLSGAIAYLLACLFLLLRQNHFMFFPTAVLQATPRDLNLSYEDIWISVTPANGKPERMHNWWIPARGVERGVVLHLHGNGHNVGANLGQALRFHQLGLSVLMVEYRGYGQSEGGFPTEASVYQDARVAWNYLSQTRGIAADRILIFGHSLGGAIAIDLAKDQPEAAGLIVQSSFTRMQAMVERAGYFRLFPAQLLLTQRFESIEKVPQLKMPVLYIHGTRDELIPYSMSQDLYAATPEPKHLFLVPQAMHNDVAAVGDTAYTEVLNQFLERHLSQPR